jgi:hypothetical protein
MENFPPHITTAGSLRLRYIRSERGCILVKRVCKRTWDTQVLRQTKRHYATHMFLLEDSCTERT